MPKYEVEIHLPTVIRTVEVEHEENAARVAIADLCSDPAGIWAATCDVREVEVDNTVDTVDKVADAGKDGPLESGPERWLTLGTKHSQ